jgi:chondroitin 4-sulfotransferase 11
VIHSAEGGVVFTHVSRTGGVAVANCLLGHFPDARELIGQHEPLAAARPVLGTLFEESFKFAFVRNPWERFVSWYALIGRASGPDDADPSAVSDPDCAHWRGFDAFLEGWAEQEVYIGGVSRRRLSQWGQLADTDGVLLTDDIGRFETFADDATRLLARVGIEQPRLPLINAAPHAHYSRYYSEFGRDLVARVYPEDVEELGYEFAGTPGA